MVALVRGLKTVFCTGKYWANQLVRMRMIRYFKAMTVSECISFPYSFTTDSFRIDIVREFHVKIYFRHHSLNWNIHPRLRAVPHILNERNFLLLLHSIETGCQSSHLSLSNLGLVWSYNCRHINITRQTTTVESRAASWERETSLGWTAWAPSELTPPTEARCTAPHCTAHPRDTDIGKEYLVIYRII